MKLSEMIPQSCALKIGSVQLHLRYDMSALLKLEQAGHEFTDIFGSTDREAITDYLSAGVAEDIGRQRAEGIVRVLGEQAVKAACCAAMITALPEYDPAVIPDTNSNEGFDFGKLRCMLCDEMGKPDELFWRSTIREIYLRWEAYARLKGYAKPVERMEMFDTEGM